VKYFHRVSSGSQHAYLLQSCIGKARILLTYSFWPEAMIYSEFYPKIFEMVHIILRDYAGESADNRKIFEMSKKFDISTQTDFSIGDPKPAG
jgi:hypothetical protein